LIFYKQVTPKGVQNPTSVNFVDTSASGGQKKTTESFDPSEGLWMDYRFQVLKSVIISCKY
jgi:hypothetical protein